MLKNEFDIKKLLERRLLKIENPEERRVAEDVLLEVFEKLGEYTQNQLRNLEDKVLLQSNHSTNGYTIVTGLVERNRYDVRQDRLYPMRLEDRNEYQIAPEKMLKVLSDGGTCQVQTIFMEAPFPIIQKLLRYQTIFDAVIYTDQGEYPAKVTLKQNTEYKKKIQQLYEIYLLNGVAWSPLCIPYLYRMFDVYLSDVQLPEHADIKRVSFHFGEYEAYVRYDRIPVWNVETLQVTADIRPEPCEDNIHYIHSINNRRLDKENLYLVADTNGTVINVLYQEQLHIVSLEKEVKKWSLYRIAKELPRNSNYPLFHNQSEKKAIVNNRTLGGVFQFVNTLQYTQYVKLNEVSFPEQYHAQQPGYRMDDFMDYDLGNKQPRQIMLLRFEAMNKSNVYNLDIMSYLVTAVQYEYREFDCIGEMG